MASVTQERQRPQACGLQYFPNQPPQHQPQAIPSRRRQALHKVAHYQFYQSQYDTRPVPIHYFNFLPHWNMASPHSMTMIGNISTPIKLEGQMPTFDSLAEEWQITDSGRFDSTEPQHAIPISSTPFAAAPSDDLYNSSFTPSNLTGTNASTLSTSFGDFDASFGHHVKPEPHSQPPNYTNNLPLPPDIAGYHGQEFSSPVYEPTLPVSPQDVFPDSSAALSYSPSPALSAYDGYHSSDESLRYGSEPPMGFGLPPHYAPSRGSALAGNWWTYHGMACAHQPAGLATSAPSSFYSLDDGEISPRSQPLLDNHHAGSAYSATEPDEDVYANTQDFREREEQNHFLIRSRLAGMSYKEIRELGNFREAESTLRGRFRDLTKRKNERVRKPVWTRRDIKLLTEVVDDIIGLSHHNRHARRDKAAAIEGALSRVSWKKVSSYIAENGGSYRFGNATCKKKYMQLAGLA